MAAIELQKLRRNFGAQIAVRDIDLSIADGSFVVLLGPSGCGKTTTLRMIAGLETPSDGRILLGEEEVTRRRPRERDIAMVFQLFALYPHFTVEDNIAFPLRNEGIAAKEIRRRVDEVAGILRIEPLLKRRIGGLSGGDRQRVALGRAIIRHPKAYLMDEPLGTLDAEFRELMCVELRRLHNQLRTTTVFVTHDQTEAMALADHIVVMKDGDIHQSDTPERVLRFPATMFVASFIGRPPMNLIPVEGEIRMGGRSVAIGGHEIPVPRSHVASNGAVLGIRPLHIKPSDDGIPARVTGVEFFGSHRVVTFDSPAGTLRAQFGRGLCLGVGERVGLTFDVDHAVLFDAASGRLLDSETTGRK